MIPATVRASHPDALEHPGIGPIGAATVLHAWSQTGRIRSEARRECPPGLSDPANSADVPPNLCASGTRPTPHRAVNAVP